MAVPNLKTLVSALTNESNVKFVVPSTNITTTYSLDALSALEDKSTPEDLAAYINKSHERVGATIFILNTTTYRITHATNKFFLTGMASDSKERVQLIETINGTNLNFFDSGLKQYSFSGTALDYASQSEENTGKYYHLSSLETFYENHLRAYKLITKKSIAVLKVHNHLIYGYPVGMGSNLSAQAAEMGSFQFGWVVVKHTRNLLGVVTDQDLNNMFLPKSNEAVIPYLKNINDALAGIDEFLLTEKYDSAKAYWPVLNELGILEIGSLSYTQIQNMETSSKDFINDLSVKSKSALNVLKQYIDDESSIIYPRLKVFFPSDTAIEKTKDSIYNAIMKMKTDYDSYLKFKEFIATLVSIKADLLIFKARLLY